MKGDVKGKIFTLDLAAGVFSASSPCKFTGPWSGDPTPGLHGCGATTLSFSYEL